MASRFEAFLEQNRELVNLGRLREGVSPTAAVMIASRLLLHYFSIELVFGVPNHFGATTETALKQIADILSHGMLKTKDIADCRLQTADLQTADCRVPIDGVPSAD